MTNKRHIEKLLAKNDLKIGIWQKEIDLLTKPNLKKVKDHLISNPGRSYIKVTLDRKHYVVIFYRLRDVVDFEIMKESIFVSIYGTDILEVR